MEDKRDPENAKADQHGHGGRREVNIKVNHKPVVVHEHRMTGLAIKETAIAQKVNIRVDFVLIHVGPHGKRDTIGDAQEVEIHEGDEFEAIADDDNS